MPVNLHLLATYHSRDGLACCSVGHYTQTMMRTMSACNAPVVMSWMESLWVGSTMKFSYGVQAILTAPLSSSNDPCRVSFALALCLLIRALHTVLLSFEPNLSGGAFKLAMVLKMTFSRSEDTPESKLCEDVRPTAKPSNLDAGLQNVTMTFFSRREDTPESKLCEDVRPTAKPSNLDAGLQNVGNVPTLHNCQSPQEIGSFGRPTPKTRQQG